jgi:hypothetical protein
MWFKKRKESTKTDHYFCIECGLELNISKFRLYQNGKPRKYCKKCGNIRVEKACAEKLEDDKKGEKICTGCGASKLYSEFYRNPVKLGCYRTRCKACMGLKQKRGTYYH